MLSETTPFNVMTINTITTNSNSFVALFFASSLAAVILLAGCNSEPGTFEVDGFPFAIQSQKVKTRIWKDLELELILVLDADAGLQRPRGAFDDKYGNLYIIDYGDYRVKKFDADGRLVQVYGDGRDEALGELESPGPLSLSPEGDVWVADGKKLLIFKETGQWLRSISFDHTLFRIGHIPDGRYYVYFGGNNLGSLQDGMFYLYDDDEQVVRFGATDLDLTTAAGEIAVVGNDLFYNPGRFEFFVRYNEEGNIIYARETIEQAPASVIEEKGRNSLFHMPMLKSSIGHYEGYIYVDAWLLSDIKGTVVIDVYRASDGSYEYSFELPERHGISMGMTIGRSKLYALRDNAIAIYSLPSTGIPSPPGE